MVKACPTCKKFVPKAAKKCPMCGNTKLIAATILTDAPTATVIEKPRPKKEKPKAPLIATLLIFFIIGITFIVIGVILFLNPCRKGHTWINTTCTEPKTCKNCGKTLDGSEKDHSWQPATCTKPKTCSVCHETTGTKLAHNVQDYICTMCGESVVKTSDVPNILDITSAKYELTSAGGIDVYMAFTNKSLTKTISYIDISMSFYNAAGDIIENEVGHGTSSKIQYTGPLSPGSSSGETYWRASFYNATFSGTGHINEIRITYSDRTKLTLDETVADEAVVDWRS